MLWHRAEATDGIENDEGFSFSFWLILLLSLVVAGLIHQIVVATEEHLGEEHSEGDDDLPEAPPGYWEDYYGMDEDHHGNLG
jgi:hypothetical protein